MRIGFDGHVLDGHSQGSRTVLVRIIEALGRQYPQHELFIYSAQRSAEIDFSRPNVHFRQTPHRGAADYLLRAMPAAKVRDELDTMVFNYIASPQMRDATVITHDVLPQTHPQYFSRLFALRCWIFYGLGTATARHLFTVSDYSRSQIQRLYPWSRRKGVDVLHMGASFPEQVYFAAGEPPVMPAKLQGLGRYALCVGRIEQRKNVQMAIDAFRAGAPADASLVIVGRREPGVELDLHGDPRIIEAGGVSDAELVSLYRNAALFLYPSSAEGFGIPLLDAILFGVPAIASNQTSMPEVAGGCAEMFDPEQPGAAAWLGERIAGHFGDRPVAPPTIDQRRERVTNYSWAHAAQELVRGIERRR